MQCPKCFSSKSKTLDSRAYKEHVKRRRVCSSCKYRYTTIESSLSNLADVGVRYIMADFNVEGFGKIVRNLLVKAMRNDLKLKDFKDEVA